jgi:SAM-dependent methyltransferase
MGLVLPRHKDSPLFVRLLYLIRRLPVGSPRRRLRFFLDLVWIFDRFSQEESCKIYENVDHPIVRTTLDFLTPLLERDFTVLDVGCANGVHLNSIAQHVNKAIGIDISSTSIEEAKTNFSRENLLFEVAECNGFLNNNSEIYDLICLVHILEHFDVPESLLLQLNGRTRYIYVEVPDFEKCITNRYRQDIDTPLVYSDADHRYEFDRNEMITLLTKCGFSIHENEYRHGVMRFWCSTLP